MSNPSHLVLWFWLRQRDEDDDEDEDERGGASTTRESVHRVWDEGNSAMEERSAGRMSVQRVRRAISATGKEKEGEGTHQSDRFGNRPPPGRHKEKVSPKPEKEKKKKNTTKGKKMKMDDTEWTKEMDEYRASLITAIANTAAIPEAESDSGTLGIKDLIENAPNHAAAPEIINSLEKESIQQTYWLNEDKVSEKSV